MAPGGRSIYVAPDGGWGWVVVFGAFVLQALTVGSAFTFGVLYVELLDVYGQPEGVTAWIGSIQTSLLYLTGLFTGPLIDKYGCRQVAILGASISTIGFATSAIMPVSAQVYPLYITYGVLTGIGHGFMFMTSNVVVQYYFNKRRSLASGLSTTGGGVGLLVFALLTQLLLGQVGLRWTLLVHAGLMLFGGACGALFRPLSKIEQQHNTGGGNDDVTRQEAEERERIPVLHTSEKGGKTAAEIENDFMPIVVTRATTHEQSRSCCSELTTVLDLNLYRSTPYILLCFAVIGFSFGIHVPYTYTPERALIYGVNRNGAATLVSIMGIANIVSRSLFGWIGDRGPLVRFILAGAALFLCGATSTAISLFTTYNLLVIYSILFGTFMGCFAAIFPVIVVDMMGIHVVSKSIGQCMATTSIPFLISSPLSGWIIASGTGQNFNLAFQVFGSLQILGGAIFLITKCFYWPNTSESLQLRDPTTYEVIPSKSRNSNL